MLVKGSGGENYTLDKKRKRAYRTFTDYPVSGSEIYVARIMNRSSRSISVEMEVKDCVSSGMYYEDERPLNMLYIRGKFAGFLYEGDGSLTQEPENTPHNELDAPPAHTQGGREGTGILVIQVVAAAAIAIIGKLVVYPLLVSYMNSWDNSSIISILHYLDYNGIPAILAGITAQIYVFQKWKDSSIGSMIAIAANLAGCVCWTIAVLLTMALVMGAIAFFLKYFVVIVLLLWIKKKFFSR